MTMQPSLWASRVVKEHKALVEEIKSGKTFEGPVAQLCERIGVLEKWRDKNKVINPKSDF